MLLSAKQVPTYRYTYLAGVPARSARRGPVVEQTIAPRCCEAAKPVFKWVLANCIISVSVGIAFAQPHTPIIQRNDSRLDGDALQMAKLCKHLNFSGIFLFAYSN